ncbi:MAG: response regulator [Rhodocyclaceae bacterium]|nr:response regulator [Rhodocyclaceae bacterium]
MIDLRGKSGLLIDDIPEMRSALRIQLADAGLEKCDMARTIKEAIERISTNRYDLIVSDYNLGQGADGQQLLELVRRKQVLPMTTAFMMITGETGYEQVSTAAEYSPDDYLIKPFTAETLRSRLERVLERKAALKPLFQQLGAKGDKNLALEACATLITTQPRYLTDILRIRGQLLMDLGQTEQALALYDMVLSQRAPHRGRKWARRAPLPRRAIATKRRGSFNMHWRRTQTIWRPMTRSPSWLKRPTKSLPRQ